MSDQEKKEPTAEEKKKAAEEAKARAKKLAAEKAKAAAEAKMKAKEKMEATDKEESGQDDVALAKAKAAAAAKAKAAAAAKARAAALAKQKASEENQNQAENGEETTDGADEKAKAAAAAKAKAAAAAKAKAAAAAKAKAAAAARAKAGAEETGDGDEQKSKEPSPNQPMLDHIVKVITSTMDTSAIEESYINELSKDEPTLVIAKDQWHEVARLLHDHPELQFDYLSSLHGVDYPAHMEVVYSMLSLSDKRGQRVTVRVKTDRENAEVPSVTDIWKGADWNEREAYDLLGIQFTGHPNLKRILLPDDWVGYPLRKDYEQLDEEV